MLIKNIIILTLGFALLTFTGEAATVIATMNSIPITDTDINSRTRLMKLQGQAGNDLNLRALANIMDDLAKLEFASQFKISPTKQEIEENIANLEKQMNKESGFFKSNAKGDEDQLNLASGANLAWQKTVFQIFAPQISVTREDIALEMDNISLAHGLPVKVTLITDGTCKDSAAKLTANEHELDTEVRRAILNLPENKWSENTGGQKFMVCKREKDKKEYKQAELYAENQATFKRALFNADQQLKTVRKKAVINIRDEKYKKVLD